jgi:hypothetical protein
MYNNVFTIVCGRVHETPTAAQFVNKFSAIFLADSSLCSQEFATAHYPESLESTTNLVSLKTIYYYPVIFV